MSAIVRSRPSSLFSPDGTISITRTYRSTSKCPIPHILTTGSWSASWRPSTQANWSSMSTNEMTPRRGKSSRATWLANTNKRCQCRQLNKLLSPRAPPVYSQKMIGSEWMDQQPPWTTSETPDSSQWCRIALSISASQRRLLPRAWRPNQVLSRVYYIQPLQSTRCPSISLRTTSSQVMLAPSERWVLDSMSTIVKWTRDASMISMLISSMPISTWRLKRNSGSKKCPLP